MLNVGRTLLLLAVVLTTATLVSSPARAKSPHSANAYFDTVSGFETYATSTEGRFAGVAAGDLPGAWQAVVVHIPLSGSAPAAITGGSFDLATVLAGSPVNVSGAVAGGSVTQVTGFTGCLNQQYDVVGTLKSVGPAGGPRKGTGALDITLTHYRTRVFGFCITYSATVTGAISLTF